MIISKLEEKAYSWFIFKISRFQRKVIMAILCLLMAILDIYQHNFWEGNPHFLLHDYISVGMVWTAFLFSAWMWERVLRDRFKQKENATRDPLTNLHNRKYLDESLVKLQKQVLRDTYQQKRSYLVLIYIDMNDLKKINDNFGHSVGSSAICTTAEIIHREIRDDVENYLCRCGGDEFCAAIKITEPASDYELIKRIGTITYRINRNLKRVPFFYQDTKIPLGVTIGAHIMDIEKNVLMEMNIADDKMKEKKKRRKVGRYK